MADNEKIGAVMVVGGGIGGIQAALDLAESGYKVYLVEESPAIGGKMAQLDKTFPTNDCSMCILSPKLVECGRHPNIELLTYSEILDLQGDAGDFRARVLRRSRYVDPQRCTGCGECAEVCPVEVGSEFDQSLGLRKAIYRPYPQAFPNIFTIEKKDRPPCVQACPAGVNAQGYVALTSKGKFEEAYRLIQEELPFPGILGRICPHPCESECRRRLVDEPLAIADLKWFLADRVGTLPPPERKAEKRVKVAIIGSGPAGLTAAYFLAVEGYQVTIFEALPAIGGMLYVGIPEYRLPRKILTEETEVLEQLGVEVRLNTKLGKDLALDDIFQQGYAAVFLAVGAHKGQRLDIPGEDCDGVVQGVDFLRDLNLGKKPTVGRTVAVIGGGNVAVDASRSALRLGAEEVTILYRRSRAEMPASDEEVNATLSEGVRIEYLVAPIEVIAHSGKVKGLKCVRMKLGEPDESGRRRPIPISGSECVVEVDMVITAIGQVPDISFLEESGVRVAARGVVEVDPVTLATSRQGVFAGGDCHTGPGIAIEAVAAGKRAAESIRRYLEGEDLRLGRAATRGKPEDLREIPQGEVKKRREEMTTLSLERRQATFDEVRLGFTEEQAVREASRCLDCGVCAECLQCVATCKANAVVHQLGDEVVELNVGSIILAPGYEIFDPTLRPEYGYGRYQNVVTSLEFERILSASGPYQGEVLRPGDKTHPKRIAWIQCVGSRDTSLGNGYCSSVCCMYAIKEAIIAREHQPDLELTIFYNDIRAFGKGFEGYYENARKLGVRFVNSIVSGLKERPQSRNLLLSYATNGEVKEEEFDLVVLSVGLKIPQRLRELAERLGLQLNRYGFCKTDEFDPIHTSRPGIFVCGAFQGPKDIPETVVQASAAAAGAGALLSPARNTLVQEKEYPPEKDVEDEEPRIGVFICHCGINIAGFLSVPQVKEYAATLPYVVFADDNLYTCSQDTQERIKEKIQEYNLNRVVVASCSPRTHEPLFQRTLREAGLNPYLFEMANIRDQCSWVHMHEPEKATAKAKALVKMALARAARLQPLHKQSLGLNHQALVIGGGIAGMTAALALADQGFQTYIVEREKELGGMVRMVYTRVNGEDPQQFLHALRERVNSCQLIEVLVETTVVNTEGLVGNFRSTVQDSEGRQRILEHGVIIVATGASEYRGPEYMLGQDKRVLTLSDLEHKLALAPDEVTGAQDIVMMLCVGPSLDIGQYCSRICCAVAIRNALRIKELNPNANIYILYRDIRTFGLREELYTQAREKGVIFVRFPEGSQPQVQVVDGRLETSVVDSLLGLELTLNTDLLVLATALIPQQGARHLGAILKVPVTAEGFFHEAHVKLRPVDFASDGIFLCGAAHYPKFIDEAVAQALAAVSRACTILAKEQLEVGGAVSQVEVDKCTACLTCVRVCPYQVPVIQNGAAHIEAGKCRGCGICVAECPARAIRLRHYEDEQVMVEAAALLASS